MGKRCNGKVRKVINGHIQKDDRGQYIPVCEFRAHPGILTYRQYRTCEKRRCRYYRTYRKPELYNAVEVKVDVSVTEVPPCEDRLSSG